MMRKLSTRLISISVMLALTFLIASAGTFAASKPVLRKGMNGSAVKTLQLNLKKLGFFSSSATGYFGSITESAVKKFQKKYKIPTTGVVATLTHSKLDALLKPKPDGLQTGNQGVKVTQLQTDLKTLGYMKVEPTGVFASITENALIQLQKKHGLEQHGVADTRTLSLIERLVEQEYGASRGGSRRKSFNPIEIEPMYEIKQEWISAIHKEPYIDGVGKYQGVVFHYTDNPRGYARSEANFVITNWHNAFVHEFIDADEIIQVADPDYKAWGAGKYANDMFIHLELCHESNKHDFDISYRKIIRRTAEYLYINQLGVSPAKSDGTGTLWSHIDVTRYLGGTNHTDPIEYLAKWGVKWSDVIRDVTDEYGSIATAYATEEIVSGESENAGAISDENDDTDENAITEENASADKNAGTDENVIINEDTDAEENQFPVENQVPQN